MTRIKERNRRKAALNDRKSAASQARMKSIANLAADDRVPKKRRKAGGGTCKRHPGTRCAHARTRAEDMFGADDADWAIYRKIVRTLITVRKGFRADKMGHDRTTQLLHLTRKKTSRTSRA